MKLVKLSLVAALTAGALSTASFATSLSDAIKDVDISGFARFRYVNGAEIKNEVENGKKIKVTHGNHEWKYDAKVIVNSKIDDNFFFVAGLKITDVNNDKKTGEYSGKDLGFELFNAYLGYNIGNTTLTIGRQTLGTFWTDDLYGSGIKVVNNDIEGLTLAALWFDSLNKDGDIKTLNKEGDFKPIKDLSYVEYADDGKAKDVKNDGVFDGSSINNHDLYGIAAIGSYDPVNFQLWAGYLKNVTKLFGAEVAFNFPINDDVKTSLKLQFSRTNFDSKFKKSNEHAPLKNSNFFGAEFAADFGLVDASVGYVNYGKKDGISLSSFEDKGSLIHAGEQSFDDYSLTIGKTNGFYATLGFNIPDTGIRIGAEYVRQVNNFTAPKEFKDDKVSYETTKTKTNEWVARAEYAHSKKLKLSAYYSVLRGDLGEVDSQRKFQFQAKYSF